ncbi:AraC family transcriptional regulator [Ascidiimonas aurantiaca]|uniref:helix-turn-helix domain-containing protein n=1 Tax=Ascidiimonas aurantiaca TaxID=1685432 RepID=UPI0030EE9693
MNNKIHIKNMVCPRCIEAVKTVFAQQKIRINYVKLGEVETSSPISENAKNSLAKVLKSKGFEILQDEKSKHIEKIKTLILEKIRNAEAYSDLTLSELLTQELHHDYSYVSKLFSSVQGITIEKYWVKQRIERVKELLFYNERSLSQIAIDLQYSSTAHLSSQFKKETGMTPSAFKKLKTPGHDPLDSL